MLAQIAALGGHCAGFTACGGGLVGCPRGARQFLVCAHLLVAASWWRSRVRLIHAAPDLDVQSWVSLAEALEQFRAEVVARNEHVGGAVAAGIVRCFHEVWKFVDDGRGFP